MGFRNHLLAGAGAADEACADVVGIAGLAKAGAKANGATPIAGPFNVVAKVFAKVTVRPAIDLGRFIHDFGIPVTTAAVVPMVRRR